MSGIDGAVKLNNLSAPSSVTETEKSVSVFDLPSDKIANKSKSKVKKDNVKDKKPLKTSDFKFKTEFDKVVATVKSLYDKVFSKTPNFKPEFDETVGDLIFYLSSKLRKINANSEFDKAFNIESYLLPSKYDGDYIPLAIKLAVWCESKNLFEICEDLLFEISSVYKTCAENLGINLLELDVATAFTSESTFIFSK